jgi:hypothetical protein
MSNTARCVCAATWPFGQPAADEAARLLAQGIDGVAALEAGLNVVELDPATGPYFVGKGTPPLPLSHTPPDIPTHPYTY